MKKIIVAFVLITAGVRVHAQAPNGQTTIDPNAPVITFDAETIDIGTVQQNGDAVRTFKFTNTGKSSLIISSVKGQCGCTTVLGAPTGTQIAPGATGTFQVKYDTSRIGMFEKKITIASNASNNSVDVKIKGNVVPAGASGGK